MTVINNITYVSQNDPKWKNLIIPGLGLDIGSSGCGLCSLSMATSFFGCFMTPEELIKHPEYFFNGLMYWAKCIFPTFSFRYYDASNDVPYDPKLLAAYLDTNDAKGNPDNLAIIRISVVLPRNMGSYDHSVLGLCKIPDDIIIIDPWDGHSKNLFLSYPYAKITGVVLFTKGKNTNKQKPIAPLYN